jgi:hypothetical protein
MRKSLLLNCLLDGEVYDIAALGSSPVTSIDNRMRFVSMPLGVHSGRVVRYQGGSSLKMLRPMPAR